MALHKKQVTYSENPTRAARAAHARGERQFRTYDTSYIRPKKSPVPTIVAAVIAIAILCIAGYFGWRFFNPSADLLPEGQEVTITIANGQDARSIGDLLADAKLVGSANEFVEHVNAMNAGTSLRPGEYTLTGGMSTDDIITLLMAGPVQTGTPLTIPEGYTIAQVAQTVQDVTGGKVTYDDFNNQAHNASAFVADFPFLDGVYENSLEGYLDPETYYLEDDATADGIIRKMLSQYQTATSTVNFQPMNDQGYSNYQILIVASLIEKEAKLDDERPLIASVIYNRLGIDMALQIDATTAYLYGPEFTPEQLHEPGPFNTYDQIGLPAAPICSPGLASIQAAAAPAETDYLYYVRTGDDGSHSFSSTFEEHQNNVNG